jgi:fumarate reductase subunit D
MAGVGGTLQAMVVSGPLAVLLLPIFVPIGAVVGAVTEPSVAASEETIAKGSQALERAIIQLQLQQRMQQSLIAELQTEVVQGSETA